MFRKFSWALCFACLVILPFLSASRVLAQDFVSAKVLASEGQVELRRAASGPARFQTVAFKVEEVLRAGDTIITGKKGRLVLGLSDGSQAIIAPKTTVVIQDLSQSPRSLFQVLKGQTRIHIEKLGGRPNPYRVNTPTAVIAVRGTIFDVLVEDRETQVFLHEGEVAVTNLTLPDQAVLLTAGQTTRVLFQRLPSPPGTFKAGRNDERFRLNHNERENRNPSGNGRIAERGQRIENPRGNPPGSGGTGPDFGRGGAPPVGPANAGRNGAPPNMPRPNSSPGAAGRKQ